MSETQAGVILRGKRRSDIADDYAWRTDPELARLDARPAPRMRFEDFERASIVALEFPAPGVLPFSIDADGEHVGNLVAYDIVPEESCEVGIVVGPEGCRGKGIGRNAMTAFLRHAWDGLGLQRVYLHTLETNGPARASFEACGFRPVARVQRQDWMLRYEVRRQWWLMEDAAQRYPHRGRRAPGADGNEAVTS